MAPRKSTSDDGEPSGSTVRAASRGTPDSGQDLRLLVRAATMYHLEGLTQAEIASRLGVSRPTAGRLVARARAQGLVRVSVAAPAHLSASIHTDLERAAGGGPRDAGGQSQGEHGDVGDGPVDGHDVEALEAAFARARSFGGPVILHAVTRKGNGYIHAENHVADQMHSTGVIDPKTGRAKSVSAQDWTSVFSAALLEAGATRPDVVAITAAMPGPTGLAPFGEKYPDRMFDVGIAEQHALTSAAGLALGGMHPVVAIYSTFLNRAFDQLLMDVALLRQPVTLVLGDADVALRPAVRAVDVDVRDVRAGDVEDPVCDSQRHALLPSWGAGPLVGPAGSAATAADVSNHRL